MSNNNAPAPLIKVPSAGSVVHISTALYVTAKTSLRPDTGAIDLAMEVSVGPREAIRTLVVISASFLSSYIVLCLGIQIFGSFRISDFDELAVLVLKARGYSAIECRLSQRNAITSE